MSRPLRIEYEDAYYHVMNRGRGRQWIFPDSGYYEDFIKCLEEAHKRFGIEIHAYCLMGNHYHLLIKTPRGNLSRAMRHINGVYTQRYNRRKKTDGPLFRGRYKAIVIDASSYLLQVSRYIHRNPIETKKPLVEQLEDYRWSSYSVYINKAKAEQWLNRDTVYGELGSLHKYTAYQSYVEQGNDIETERFYQLKNTPAVWGSQSFKEQAYAFAQSLDIEIDKKGLKNPVQLLQIVRTVSEYYELPVEAIRVATRGQGVKSVPRWVAMKLCQEIGGAKLSELAVEFNVGHYSTISQTIGRLNRLMLEAPVIAAEYKLLSQDLTP